MDAKIVSTTQANNWFFYHFDDEVLKEVLVFHRIAVWATFDSGETKGLLSVNLKSNEGQRLVLPPPLDGGYIHWDEMSKEQRAKAISGARIGNKTTAIGG